MVRVAAEWYESATFWTVSIGAATTLLGGIVGAWLTNVYAHPRRQFRYTFAKNSSLLIADTAQDPLTVRHGTTTLNKPRLIEMRFSYRGKKPLTQDSFHAGNPIVIDLKAEIISEVAAATGPHTVTRPPYSTDGTKFKIEPALWVPNQWMNITLLVDGEYRRPDFSSTLTDATPLESEAEEQREAKRNNRFIAWVALIGSICLVIFVILAVGLRLKLNEASDELYKSTYELGQWKARVDNLCEKYAEARTESSSRNDPQTQDLIDYCIESVTGMKKGPPHR